MVTISFQLLFFMHLLSELLVLLCQIILSCFIVELVRECLCSNKFIDVCVGTENVACGSGMSKNLHSLVDH